MKKLIIFIMMFGSVYSQCLGDMNEDGIKDILDIVNLVNDILDGDDVCEETSPYGCTDPSSCNFDPYATIFDNSCEYPPQGCPCNEVTEVELWGECYNIETTTELYLSQNQLTTLPTLKCSIIPYFLGNIILIM